MFAILTGLLVIQPLLVSAQKAPEIPTGTTVSVRMIDNLSSETAVIGDSFHGTLEEPISVDGREIYPKGADVNGRVVDVHKSGRLSEPGELNLILSTIGSGNRTSSLHVQPLLIKGESHTKSNTTKIGGGAALGAIIGAVAGGGKGAAIGTVVGAGAGTGAAAATGKREASVESEAVLTFVTTTAAAVSGTSVPGEAPSSASSSASSDIQSSAGSSVLFTMRDRRVIRNCLSEHASELPPGTTQKAALPSGAERSLHRDGTVPAEIEKKLQSLPLACVRQLPGLPDELERVVYAGHVMLINSSNRILDMFDLE